MPVVIALVVERETSFLQRREIAADRPGGDFELLGQRIDRRAVPRRFKRVKQLPLPDDFLVAGHGGILTSAAFLETTNLAAAAAIGRAGGLCGRPVHALDASGFDFFWCRLGRDVVVKGARLRLLDVLIDRDADDHVLEAPEAAADANPIAFANQSVWFGAVAIDLHLATFTGALGLGSRLEETRDVEPDVEANAVRGVVAHRPSDQNFNLPLGLEAIDEGFRLLLAVPLLEVLLDLRLDLFERNRAAALSSRPP